MPPKVRITREEIIDKALQLVRESGADAVNARGVAVALGSSTQPIFSNFSSMEELESAVIELAYSRYLGFIKREVESDRYPKYKAFGMAYLRFAKEEKELFKLLFMRDRGDEELVESLDFQESVEIIMRTNGVSREAARLMHLEMWACVHGIATMLVTSFLPLEWELISEMVSDVYQGIRVRQLEKESSQ